MLLTKPHKIIPFFKLAKKQQNSSSPGVSLMLTTFLKEVIWLYDTTQKEVICMISHLNDCSNDCSVALKLLNTILTPNAFNNRKVLHIKCYNLRITIIRYIFTPFSLAGSPPCDLQLTAYE